MKAVELIRPHTHAGIEHPVGTVITVAPGTAAYLKDYGIGRLVLSRGNVAPPKPLTKNRTRGGSKS